MVMLLVDTGMPWRARLDPWSLNAELTQLRTACWIVIAYLSGMRYVLRSASPAGTAQSANPEPTAGSGNKLRGRVFKDRRLSGDEADWVCIVHQAVEVLLRADNDPARLFGYAHGDGFQLLSNMSVRLSRFAAHADDLFGSPQAPIIPGCNDEHEAGRWSFTTMQFRRTLATSRSAWWPGHASTSTPRSPSSKATPAPPPPGSPPRSRPSRPPPGWTTLKSSTRDWLSGGPSGGGAATGINAEFARIQAELAELPGSVAGSARAHDARPPHRHAAPRRARRLLLPARDGAVRQARPAARPPAAPR